jgi:hypothetical protein
VVVVAAVDAVTEELVDWAAAVVRVVVVVGVDVFAELLQAAATRMRPTNVVAGRTNRRSVFVMAGV